MSATTTPPCALGLTPDDLSAWRDHALDAAGERRITAHVAACPACQRTIATHEALAAGLRAQQPPAPDPANWARLQARIAAAPATGRPTTPYAWAPRWRRAALWSGLSAVAAALIITTLFFSLFAQQTAHRKVKTGPLATPAPVATLTTTKPVKGAPLTWQTYAAPAAAVPPPGNQSLLNGFAFAPGDARTGYICAAQNIASDNPLTIWATHNGAQSWTPVATLPNHDQISACDITVDAQNPLRLNLLVNGENVKTFTNDPRSYMSDDGGQTWRALTKPLQLDGLVSRGQTSLAVGDIWATNQPLPGTSPLPVWHLLASHDGFRTWTPIDGQLIAQNLRVTGVWQRPGDGALLATTISSIVPVSNTGYPLYTYALWQSADMGAHWTEFSTPANLHGGPGYLIAQPRDSDPWRVCGLTLLRNSSQTTGELVACTLDGGQTWTSRPLPDLGPNCGGPCAQQETLQPSSALLDDGTIVTVYFPLNASGINEPEAFALPASASQWEGLGPMPAGAMITIEGASEGTSGATLVAYSGGSNVTGSAGGGFAGDLVGQIGGPVPIRGELAFATLP